MMRRILTPTGLALAITLTACAASPVSGPVSGAVSGPASPQVLIEQKFAEWRDGAGSPFDLLAEDAAWTVEGTGRLAGTYDREGLVRGVVAPFNAVLAAPLKPTVPDLYRDGPVVIAVFNASAPLKSGGVYTNRYAWIMTFEGEEIVRVSAFLDLAAFEQVFPFGH